MRRALTGQEDELTPVRSWAELAGAWSLAIAWPIFQGASSGPDAMTMLRADRLDLLVFTALLILIGPSLIWAAEMLLRLASTRVARVFHALMLGGLFGLVVWQGFGGTATLVVSAALIAALYLKLTFFENMAGIMALATPVVILGFWFTGPGGSVMLPHGSPDDPGEANGAPVVIVMLDEFPLASIESAPDRIDRENFPNFARLAEEGNWYRNARTVADVTVGALPALVAGTRQKSDETPPDSYNYPDNLFSVLGEAGYRIDAEESITDLCPHDLCPERGTLANRLSRLLINGTENSQPLPRNQALVWAERFRNSAIELEPSPKIRADTFIRNVEGEERRVSFVHLLLPHIPWIYLPNGQDYPSPIAPGLVRLPGDRDETWAAPKPKVDAAFQQMVLQAGFVDTEIGRLIARMKQEGIWDDAFFAVVADHGGSFEAGGKRRYLTEENAGWVLPVPMFVKMPGQEKGGPVDRPVTSLDLLPTVYEATGLDTPEGLEGKALPAGNSRDPLKSHSTSLGDLELDEAMVRRQFEAAVAYRNQTFTGDSVHALGGQPGLLGRPAGRVAALQPLRVAFDPPWPAAPVDLSLPQIPAYVTGTIGTPVDGGRPLAISLNGKVAGTLRSWQEGNLRRFAFTLPPELFRDGINRVRLFEITR